MERVLNASQPSMDINVKSHGLKTSA